jgi:hypothetical protein
MSRKFRSGGSTQTKLERGKNYKYDNSGNLVENTAGTVADDEFTFTGSKSSLRRIADLERNVSILIAKSQADGASSTVVSGTVTNDDWDSYWSSRDQSETLKGNKYYEDDIQIEGNLRVDGSVDFRDGFSTTTKATIKDIVGGMISNNTESGISVTFDSTSRTFDFNVSDPTITLTGDVSGTATMTNLGNVSITATVANDSHTHAFANITGKPTTLAGYGITDSLSSTGKAADSNLLDGLDSSAFARSNANDTLSGVLTFSNTTASTSSTTGAAKFAGGVGIAGKLYVGDLITSEYGAVNLNSYTIDASTYDVDSKVYYANGTHYFYGTINGDLTGDVTGNADTASKWATARTLSLTGDASGSVSIDGSGNMSLSVAVANDSHTHAFSNLTGKPTTLAGYGITDAYTETEVDSAISVALANLTGNASAAFDTLQEIQTAVTNNDTDIATILSTQANKADKTTTISAGAGLTGGGSLGANRTISHADTSSQASVNNSGRTYIQDITLDAFGHITGISSATETVTDTHYTSLNVIGATGTTTNASTTNGNTYLKHVENGALTSSHKIAGSGATTVTTDANGNITISSTDTDTNTWRGISDTPGNDSTVSISRKWAMDAFVGASASNDTITFTKGDGTTVAVSTSDANTWRGITDTPTNDSTTSISAAWAQTAFVGATVSNDTITFTKGDGTTTSVTTSDANTNTYVTGASFNAADGVLTLTRNSGSVTVDLDGRFTDNAYADTMNQHVRTTDSPTFAAVTATNFNGTATYAKYADLAERYAADAPYEEGTLLAFGGEAEVTAAQGYASTKIAGVVSVKPAVAMNAEAGNSQTHPFVALQGRVPVKVVGTVRKGDILVASDISGVATVWKSEDTDPRMTAYVGIAIENKIEGGVGFVEVKVGK